MKRYAKPEPLTELEKATIAEWARRDLQRRLDSETEDPIADPRAWQIWRYRQLVERARNPEGQVRPQLARLARAWKLIDAPAQPAQEVIIRAAPDTVERFRDLALLLLRLPAAHPLHEAHRAMLADGAPTDAMLDTLEAVALQHGLTLPTVPAFQGAEP